MATAGALKHLALAGLCACVLFACAGPPHKEGAESSTERAVTAESKGNFKGAAREYSKLAATSAGAQRETFQLNAVAALIRGAYLNEAKRILDAIDLRSLPPILHARHRMLAARIAFAQRDSTAILALLAGPATTELPIAMRTEIYRLRGQAYQMNNELLRAAKEYVQLTKLLTTVDGSNQVQQLIWQILGQLSVEELASVPLDEGDDTFNGWITLAMIAKQPGASLRELGDQLYLWRQQHPLHPAADEIIASLLLLKQEELARPQNIAILLPLGTGSFSEQASAVRDGILAAFYNRTNRDYTPAIHIYDVGQNDGQAWADYMSAVNDNADFIIGPLAKNNVNLIARHAPLSVPTLVMNYAEQGIPALEDNLFQIGLAPEDEARQVAERAWFDGHSQALVFVPRGNWGQRVFDAFSERWETLGGKVLEAHSYNSRNSDFSMPIKKLLDLDQSESRRRRLQTIIGKHIEAVPRRRRDADFIFVAAFPRQGRLIVPQLKFHYAGDMQVYATSHIYSGKRDTNADRDMNGVLFCDMPWILLPETDASPLRRKILRIWPDKARDYSRFYALGVDAFAVIAHLKHLRNYDYERFAGRTGSLNVDDAGRVHRQLLWARFKNGIATLADTRAHAEATAAE